MAALYIPAIAKTSVVLCSFAAAIFVLHLLLVWPRNLSKRAWKKVDYIWTFAALLGLVGTVDANRRDSAASVAVTMQNRLELAADEIGRSIDTGNSEVVCRKFVRSAASPAQEEFDRVQAGFDRQCDWYAAARSKLDASPLGRRPITFDDLGGKPPDGGEAFVNTWLQERMANYNSALEQVNAALAASRESEFERILRLLSPLLLAFALAIRIAKISGELRHDAA